MTSYMVNSVLPLIMIALLIYAAAEGLLVLREVSINTRPDSSNAPEERAALYKSTVYIGAILKGLSVFTIGVAVVDFYQNVISR